MSQDIKMRFHRPKDIGAISISCENAKFVSFNLDYKTTISEISKDNLDISKAVGSDLSRYGFKQWGFAKNLFKRHGES